jgi:purine-binding chemotaxis protein CheW
MTSYCTFTRAGVPFGVPVDVVTDIVWPQPLSPVPGAPSEVLGAFLHRRAVVPVLSIDRWLGVATGTDRNAVWLVVRIDTTTLAIVADQGVAVIRVDAAARSADITHPWATGALVAGDRTTTLLDADRLLRTLHQHVADGVLGRGLAP